MEEEWTPFELVKEGKKTILRLHGKSGHVLVTADRLPLILDAIGRGWDIDIINAVIEGDLDVKNIDNKYRDAEGKVIIRGDVCLSCVSFLGEVCFDWAIFMGRVYFSRVRFEKKARFFRVSFRGYVFFLLETTFKEEVVLFGSCFSRAAQFNGIVVRSSASFKSVVFQAEAHFAGADLGRIAEFNGAIFSGDPHLKLAELRKLTPRCLDQIGWAYRQSHVFDAGYFFALAGERYSDQEAPEYSRAADSFRNAKVEYEKEGKYDEAGEMYVREKDSIRKQLWHQMRSQRSSFMKRSIKWLGLNAWKVSCNYGEAPLWFIGWAAFIILFFALIYSPFLNWWPPESCESWALIEFREYPYAEGNSFLTALYFSVVTFATLGFGDITPMNSFGKVVVIIEVLSGYVMFGILITLVARRMTRS